MLFFKRHLNSPERTSQISTDASLSGWGAVNLEKDPTQIAAGTWLRTEKGLPIAILEAKAVLKGLKAFTWHRHQKIVTLCDNKAAVGAINKGGSTKSRKLQEIVKRIWKWTERRKLLLKAKYIKGKHNLLADQLSRKNEIAPGEWSLSQEAFAWICNLGYKPEIDMFSSDWNRKLPTYCTLYKSPNTQLMDALSLDWSRWKIIYLFPPPILLLKVLNRIKTHKGTSLLVFPDWPNRPWHQLITQRAKAIHKIPDTGLWQGLPDAPIKDSPKCWQRLLIAFL